MTTYTKIDKEISTYTKRDKTDCGFLIVPFLVYGFLLEDNYIKTDKEIAIYTKIDKE